MRDSGSKTAWEAENVIKVTCKINRNQDPLLFELLTNSAGSVSQTARELMRKAIQQQDEKPEE